MSVNPSYTLRLKAQGDLESIWQYSFTTWGSAQADHYLRALVTRFEWLADSKNKEVNKGSGLAFCLSLLFYFAFIRFTH
jgi:plasmid stabilization system protein ParE